MKKSKLKNSWQRKRLGEVCDFQNGFAFKSSQYSDSGFFVIRIANVQDGYIELTNPKFVQKSHKSFENFILQSGDILVSLTGNVGRVGIVKKKHLPAVLNQRVARIAIKEKNILDKNYFFYFLCSAYFIEELIKAGHGAAQQNISTKDMQKLVILLPRIPEQKRIVKVLDEVFEKVEKAKENAEKNLKNSCELFESYLQSVFTNPDKDWEERKLGDNKLLEIIDGDRGKNYPKKSDFLDEGHCLFLNTKNVRPDGFDFDSTMFITEDKDRMLRKGKLQRKDVVMTTRGTIGNLGFYSDEVKYKNIRINSGMLIFRTNTKEIIPEYLFEVLRSGVIKSQIKKHVSGAAQPQLPIKTLVNFTLQVPKSLSDQRVIVKKLDELLAQTKKLKSIYEQRVADLEELRKSVLKKAFNGEL